MTFRLFLPQNADVGCRTVYPSYNMLLKRLKQLVAYRLIKPISAITPRMVGKVQTCNSRNNEVVQLQCKELQTSKGLMLFMSIDEYHGVYIYFNNTVSAACKED